MGAPAKRRVKAAIEGLPAGDVKLLKGRAEARRLRVGGWRVLFSHARGDTILIEKIAPRGQIYKGV
jgi:mRNA interferase RelE/StbE